MNAEKNAPPPPNCNVLVHTIVTRQTPIMNHYSFPDTCQFLTNGLCASYVNFTVRPINLGCTSFNIDNHNAYLTRMHSSRMRTVRSVSHLPRGVYLVPGGVPGPGGVPSPRGCTWSQGVYLVLGGVPSSGGVPGPGRCTWSWQVYLVPRGCTWSQGVYLVPRGVPGPRGCTWS